MFHQFIQIVVAKCLCKHYICTSEWLQSGCVLANNIKKGEKLCTFLLLARNRMFIEIAASLIGHSQRFNVCLYVLLSQQLLP